MGFEFFMPAQVLSGKKCVARGADELAKIGKRCLMLTGGKSTRSSGAVDDMCQALQKGGVAFDIFEGILPNPTLSQCRQAARQARAFGADFIVGVGGGSVLDAAKATAVYAANPMENLQDIFHLDWQNPALALVLVGTTAGTGSEVSAVSVLTVDETHHKQSIKHRDLYGRLVFADPSYTITLPQSVTISTGLDALCHAMEGYFSNKATVLSDTFALKAAGMLVPALMGLANAKEGDSIAYGKREMLYYGSLFAGSTLNLCGTGFPHTLGYLLTENHDVPHGLATAFFLPHYLTRAGELLPLKARELQYHTGVPFVKIIDLVTSCTQLSLPPYTVAQVAEVAKGWNNPPNFANSTGTFTVQDGQALLEKLLVH